VPGFAILQSRKYSPKNKCDFQRFDTNRPQGIRSLFESYHQLSPYRLVYPIPTKRIFAPFAPWRFNLFFLTARVAQDAKVAK
jgi:hypothetical protein